MSNTRTQISSRVHGVPRRTAKAHTQSPDEDADDIRADSRRNGTDFIGENHPDNEHQEESSNEFTKEVGRIVADSRSRAEDTEFRRFIFRFSPMGQVSQPDDSCAEDTAQDLSDGRGEELRNTVNPDHRLAERNSRVQVTLRSTEGRCRVNAESYGETPSCGYTNPAAVLAFRFGQRVAGADAGPEDDEDHRPDKFS